MNDSYTTYEYASLFNKPHLALLKYYNTQLTHENIS